MLVDRELPTQEARDLIALTRELADAELAPKAAQYEREERFPREVFRAARRRRPAGPALR